MITYTFSIRTPSGLIINHVVVADNVMTARSTVEALFGKQAIVGWCTTSN